MIIKKLLLITIIISIALMTKSLFPQAGTPDPSFDGDGIALFDFTGFHETAWDMAALDDTTILLCGTTNQSEWFVSDGYLMKVNPDGSQDMSWGTNGLVIFDYGEDTYPYKMEVLSDGKILVAGPVYITVSDAEFFVARFNPDGTPDATFGINGLFTSSYTTSEEVCETMTLQPDGKIVLAGRTYSGAFSQLLFMRVNADGTLDTSFGTNGYTEIDASVQDERINSVGILSNGSIVGVGYGYQSSPWFGEQAVIAKLHADGNPNTSFGSNGVVIPPFISDISLANDIEIKNDSLFVTGWQNDAANDMELFLVKLDSSAAVDPSFANNGLSLVNINPMNIGSDILLNEDEKIYVCGTSGLGGTNNRDFFVLRYLSDGTLDPDFNGTGYLTTDIRPDWDEAYAIDLQVDGKIVCAGMSGGLTSSGNNDIPVTRYLNDFNPSGCYADFIADPTLLCDGSSSDFTDLTISTDSVVISWEWTFEGGTPATSTQQNPTVTYVSEGVFDVQLIVTDGIYNDTILKEDYIIVETLPSQPDTPVGPTELCGTYEGTYVTNPVTYADEYEWDVNPPEAGTMTGNDTSAVFQASNEWEGTCTIKVRGEGLCGDGAWSPGIQVDVWHNPIPFQLTGDGAYCEGDPGSEIILEGSETGVDYELYYEGDPTGNIVPGTGSAISFGLFSEEGLYDAKGFTIYCTEDMYGQIYVYIQPLPDQPAKPAGPEAVCNYEETSYYVGIVANSNALIWTVTPPEAGDVYPSGQDAVVVWNSSFTGLAELTCHGENDCGDGPESVALEIDVFGAPTPEISGPEEVCSGYEELYETENIGGNIYGWTVTGGEIVYGSGTANIYVEWGAPGLGTLQLVEFNPMAGCSDTTDIYEVTIDECSFIGDVQGQSINVYPNPTSDFVHMDLQGTDHSGEGTIMIFNALGTRIEQLSLIPGKDQYTVDLSGSTPGLYFIQVVDNEKVVAKGKIVMER